MLENYKNHLPDSHKNKDKNLDHQLQEVPCTKGIPPVPHHSDLTQTFLQCFFNKLLCKNDRFPVNIHNIRLETYF